MTQKSISTAISRKMNLINTKEESIYLNAVKEMANKPLTSIAKMVLIHLFNNISHYTELPVHTNKHLFMIMRKFIGDWEMQFSPNFFSILREDILEWTPKREEFSQFIHEQQITLGSLETLKAMVIDLEYNDLENTDIEIAISSLYLDLKKKIFEMKSVHLEAKVREKMGQIREKEQQTKSLNQEINNIFIELENGNFHQNFKILYKENIQVLLACLNDQLENLNSEIFIVSFLKSISGLSEFDLSKYSFGDICIQQKQILTFCILNNMLQINAEIEEKQNCFELGIKLLTGQIIPTKLQKLQSKLFINGFILSFPINEKKRPFEPKREERPSKRNSFYPRFGPPQSIGFPPPPHFHRFRTCNKCKIKFTSDVFSKHIKLCK